MPGQSVLATVRGVELIHAGSWDISTGHWDVTPDDLVEAVAALECPAVRRPILKLGHVDPRFDGEPALGFVANLAVAASGQALVGDYVGVPAWLTEVDDEGRSVLASAYPDRSVEGVYDFGCQLGHVHPFVLTGVALLGVMPPGVGTLASLSDVAALYGVAASADPTREPTSTGRHVAARLTTAPGGDLMPAPTRVAAAVNVQDVRRAYYDGPAVQKWSWWITDIYLDPNYLLVMDDDTELVYQVPFTVDGDAVTFGDPVTGRMVWQPADGAVAASGPRPVAAASYPRREDSRPQAAASSDTQNPPASPVEDNSAATGGTTPEGAGMDPAKIREAFGLPADASDVELQAAIAAAGLAPATTAPEQLAPVTSLPEGTVAVDAATLDELRVAAAAGREAREQQLADRRQSLVDAAIGDGRIAPVRRDHWLTSLQTDPGSEQVLASLQPGLIPVAAKGHDGGESAASDPSAADDYWFGGVSAVTTAQEG